MKKMTLFTITLIGLCFASHLGFAEEAKNSASATDAITKTAESLAADLKKARDIILDGSGGNPFGRGFMIALFEPMFIASMFAMGLWAGQMNDKLRNNIWAPPVVAFASIVIGAFITTYHSDWKPDLTNDKLAILAELNSTDAVAVVIGLVIGGMVGTGFTVIPLFGLAVVGAMGLALGFSQTAEVGAHKNALIPFWGGFGLTGLLITIFGIGFETFLESINLSIVTRWLGLGIAALSLAFGAQVF
jgi:hypothetical protein